MREFTGSVFFSRYQVTSTTDISHKTSYPRKTVQQIPESWNIGLRRISARIPYTFFKGMRILMFQLSGLYCGV